MINIKKYTIFRVYEQFAVICEKPRVFYTEYTENFA